MSISIRNFLSTLLVLTLSLGGASHLRAADRASTIFERAKEAFARNDYVDAEWLSLCATSDAKKTNPFATNKVILALELAGLSASSLHEHVRAITYFSEGEALAGKSRDLLEWARIVHELAQSLIRRGENPQAEWRLRQAIGVRNEKLGLAHPDTLESMSSLATLFDLQGKFALAEAGHRSVYTNRVRIFGGDHPSTLTSQHNLYAAVFHKGEYVLAGIGLRELIKRRSRGLGAEHPDQGCALGVGAFQSNKVRRTDDRT